MEMCDGTPGQLHVNGHSFANNYNVKTSITRDWALGIGYWIPGIRIGLLARIVGDRGAQSAHLTWRRRQRLRCGSL